MICRLPFSWAITPALLFYCTWNADLFHFCAVASKLLVFASKQNHLLASVSLTGTRLHAVIASKPVNFLFCGFTKKKYI